MEASALGAPPRPQRLPRDERTMRQGSKPKQEAQISVREAAVPLIRRAEKLLPLPLALALENLAPPNPNKNTEPSWY